MRYCNCGQVSAKLGAEAKGCHQLNSSSYTSITSTVTGRKPDMGASMLTEFLVNLCVRLSTALFAFDKLA